MGVVVKTNLLPKLISQLRVEADSAAGELASRVAEDAIRNAPEKTGKLKRSIAVENTGRGKYEVATGVEYAAAVEYGTVDTPAHPYLAPALAAHAGEIDDLMKQAVDRSIS